MPPALTLLGMLSFPPPALLRVTPLTARTDPPDPVGRSSLAAAVAGVLLLTLLTIPASPAQAGSPSGRPVAERSVPEPSAATPGRPGSVWTLPVGADRPLSHVLLRRFEAPAHRYAAGHRGVDLRADPGSVVVSPAAGVVAYAGRVAGRSVVSVAHDDGHRSSLLPVTASVAVGTRVAAGDPVGRVAGGPDPAAGAHCGVPCVHWGVRLAGDYVDPLRLLHPPIRLLPRHGAPDGGPW